TLRDWYVWSPKLLDWVQTWEGGKVPTWHQRNGAYYYATFWGEMPDLNFKTAAVREEMKKIAALWLDRGADGFRMDGARYLVETGSQKIGGQADTPETHQYWKEFAAFVRHKAPTATLIGENWLPDSRIIASYYGNTSRI